MTLVPTRIARPAPNLPVGPDSEGHGANLNRTPHSPTLSRAVFKREPGDFVVDEQLRHQPSGEGANLWLQIRKRSLDTLAIVKLLANAAGLPNRAIGYAGMKDRHGLCTQWFSVALESRPEPNWALVLPRSCEVLAAIRNPRKLKIGGLTGNRFELRLREVEGDRARIEDRLEAIRCAGMPNYFGPQRFGLGGNNLGIAAAMLAGQRKVKDRKWRGIYLSAARSHLFNAVLARRVQTLTWDALLPGELLMLDGTHSVFPDDGDKTLLARVRALDVHPTGPLWGRGSRRVSGAALEVEDDVLAAEAAIRDGLERFGLEQDRRALRVRSDALRWCWESDGAEQSLTVSFTLAAGAYASVLTEQVFDEVDDQGGQNSDLASARP